MAEYLDILCVELEVMFLHWKQHVFNSFLMHGGITSAVISGVCVLH